ncbi:hypothetical protein Ae201684P_022023 [Aphanomyces euteiches]|nr:hypothetical protein Ae201684P_022007 [Aphanomyces euteiches]KAH9072445.1 hypothetical protein Ae201684P_022023 [Aphanomyces euteiches]KAH9153471.1 hypothetical protein AeRB84_004297 [Aphanomyces euteiches]
MGLSTATVSRDEQSINQPTCQLYLWGGRMHKLPENVLFPSVDLRTAWQLWWLGNKSCALPPFRRLDPIDFSISTQRRQLSEWKFAMYHLEGVFASVTGKALYTMPTEDDVSKSFATIVPYIESICAAKGPRGRARRLGQLKFLTVVRDIRLDVRSKRKADE